MNKSDKVLGMFLGIAIGDALGMPVETFTPAKIQEVYGKVTDYHRPDQHKWFDGHEAGTTTDDTQLTVAVAEALIESKGFDMDMMVKHHVKALEEDSGWGRGTRTAVEALRDGEHWSRVAQGDTDKHHGPGSGNGIPMKIAPMAAWDFLCSESKESQDVDQSVLYSAGQLARMTHKSRVAQECGELHVCAVRYLLATDPAEFNPTKFKQDALMYVFEWFCCDELFERMIAACSVTDTRGRDQATIDYLSAPDGERSRFTCLVSYPAALYAFLSNPLSIESVYTAIALGGDTDTNASIVGGMLGALHGPSIFPSHLVEGLKQKDQIIDLSNRFCECFKKGAEIAV